MTNVSDTLVPERPKSKQKFQPIFDADDEEGQRSEDLTYFESLMKGEPKTKRFLTQESTELGPWKPQASNILTQKVEKANQKKRKSTMPLLLLEKDSDNNALTNQTELTNETIDRHLDANSVRDDPQLSANEARTQRTRRIDELGAKTNLRAALTNFSNKVSEGGKKFPISARAISIQEETEDPEAAYTIRNGNKKQAPAKFFQQKPSFINSQSPISSEETNLRSHQQETIPSPKFPYLSELIPPQKLTRRVGKNVPEASHEFKSDISSQQNTYGDVVSVKVMPGQIASFGRIKMRNSVLRSKLVLVQEPKPQAQKNITPNNIGLSPADSVVGKRIHFYKYNPAKKPVDEELLANKEQEGFSLQEVYSSDKKLKVRAPSANSSKKDHYEFFLPGVKLAGTPRKESLGTYRGGFTKINPDEIPLVKFNTRKPSHSKLEGKSHQRGVSATARDRTTIDDPLSNHFTQTYDVQSTLKILKKINQNARMLRPARKSTSVPNRKDK